jgi:hypothetical protein
MKDWSWVVKTVQQMERSCQCGGGDEVGAYEGLELGSEECSRWKEAASGGGHEVGACEGLELGSEECSRWKEAASGGSHEVGACEGLELGSEDSAAYGKKLPVWWRS